jgi:hypothetical protein
MNSWPLTITSSGHKKATLLVPRRSAFSAADVKRSPSLRSGERGS